MHPPATCPIRASRAAGAPATRWPASSCASSSVASPPSSNAGARCPRSRTARRTLACTAAWLSAWPSNLLAPPYAPTMAPTIRLGKILGIDVGLNWSLVFIYALIVWTLATDVLPVDVPNQGALTYWAIGAIGGVVFYACLLAHELAHALVAKRYGVKVSGISLWLFGGVSRLDGEPPSAGAEALIAAVGPLTSFVIAGVALGLMFAAGASPLVSDVFAWLAYVNVALGLFNLVPAFPLDGGRLLSSLFWWRQGTRQRGVHSAVRIGRVLAYVMIALGIVLTFTVSVVNGIWLAFIGWFLLSAGSQEEAGSVMKAALRS